MAPIRAMFALTLAVSALGFNADSKLPALRAKTLVNDKLFLVPESKLLALRGGGVVSNDVLIKSLASLFIVTGLQGWVAPKATMASYGVAEMSDHEGTYLRLLSGINFVAGATMLASEETAASLCLIMWALSTTANIPLLEAFDAPKPAIAGFAAVFGGLGLLGKLGVLSADIVTYIAAFFLIPVSIPEIINPQTTFDMFNMPSASPLVKSLFGNFSWIKVCIGLFLLVRKLTGKAGFALAAAMVGNLANLAQTLVGADKAGLGKLGLIVWAVICSVVGGLGLANDI